MNKFSLLPIILTSLSFAFTAPESAFVLEKGERSNGIFQPMRYGLGNDMELQVHRIHFCIRPNLTLQKYYREINGWGFAARHHISYPTLLLRLIQKEGTAGIIAPDPEIDDIPQMLYWTSEFIFSHQCRQSLVTATAGFALGLGGSDMDERLWIDYPMIYHRMGVLFNGLGLHSGTGLRIPLTNELELQLDATVFFLPGAKHDTFFEQKSTLTWQWSKNVAFTGGYVLSHGEYPFGSQWFMVPIFDVIWCWSK